MRQSLHIVELAIGSSDDNRAGCHKVLQRQDARVKHYRRQHPEMITPVTQKRSADYSATSLGSYRDAVYGPLDMTQLR
jgi:hypothetical protein